LLHKVGVKDSHSDLLERLFDSRGPKPPVVIIPGLASSRLVAWKRKPCRGADINVQVETSAYVAVRVKFLWTLSSLTLRHQLLCEQDIVWLNLQKVIETMTYDPRCWVECMKVCLGSIKAMFLCIIHIVLKSYLREQLGKNQTDPEDCKLRPDEGLGRMTRNMYYAKQTAKFQLATLRSRVRQHRRAVPRVF
jgi:hypothetical protein